MRVKIKKAISVLTVIAMLLCPISAFAAQYQGTIKWYHDRGDDDEFYDELPYYGEISLGKTTVEAPESNYPGESEYVFKMTAQEAGWYYFEFDAGLFNLLVQKEIRDDGMPLGFIEEGYYAFETDNPVGYIIYFESEETKYLDFYYGDNTFTVNVEYFGNITGLSFKQGSLDNLVYGNDFGFGDEYVWFNTGSQTVSFDSGKSVELFCDFSYTGALGTETGEYDITVDFEGLKQDVTVSVYDLAADIDHVEIANQKEIEEVTIKNYYTGNSYFDRDYEAEIIIYFKNGSTAKAYDGNVTETKPFTAPNGREYYAFFDIYSNGEFGVTIPAANLYEDLGTCKVKNMGLAENLQEMSSNCYFKNLGYIYELYGVLSDIEEGTATFGDFFRIMFENEAKIFGYFFQELGKVLRFAVFGTSVLSVK